MDLRNKILDPEAIMVVRDLLRQLSSQCQSIRIQQVQLLAESNWENKEKYRTITDQSWTNFNKAHKKLWDLVESETTPKSPESEAATSDLSFLNPDQIYQ